MNKIDELLNKLLEIADRYDPSIIDSNSSDDYFCEGYTVGNNELAGYIKKLLEEYNND